MIKQKITFLAAFFFISSVSICWAATDNKVFNGSLVHSRLSSGSEIAYAEDFTNPKTACVILLHGLGRSAFSMKYIERKLSQSDYFVVNHSYPSMEHGIDQLAQQVIGQSIQDCRDAGYSSVSFVTHSMGGILVRSYLQNRSIPELRRVVMLAPPNHGSELINKAVELAPRKYHHSQSFLQLDSDKESYVNQLKDVHSDIGIIAGNVSINPLFSNWLDGDDDSKVTVKSACLKEMTQLLIYPVNHTMITFSSNIVEQIEYFLTKGEFQNAAKGKIITDCRQLVDSVKREQLKEGNSTAT